MMGQMSWLELWVVEFTSSTLWKRHRHLGFIDGLQSDDVTGLDAEGDWVVAIHPKTVLPFSTSVAGTVVSLNEATTDLDSDSPTGVAIHNGVAYIGTQFNGLNRYIIANQTFLGAWVSTGINDVDFAPVAILGSNPKYCTWDCLDMELQERPSTGEILIPLTRSQLSKHRCH